MSPSESLDARLLRLALAREWARTPPTQEHVNDLVALLREAAAALVGEAVAPQDALGTALAFCRFVQLRDDVPAVVKSTARDVEEELRAVVVGEAGTPPDPRLVEIAGIVNGYHNGTGVDAVEAFRTLREIADVLGKPMERAALAAVGEPNCVRRKRRRQHEHNR